MNVKPLVVGPSGFFSVAWAVAGSRCLPIRESTAIGVDTVALLAGDDRIRRFA
ncbi:MAG: hypothetical protein V5B35_18765 [Candidatus Accumulibacter necessarius]